MNNKSIMTDFYELTMAQTYFDSGKKDEEVYFDIFFRNNPFNGGYTLSGGLEEIINYVQNFKYGEEEINYLRSLKIFNEKFLNYLSNLEFKGDIFAVPDGTVVFPNEPVITVKADAVTAQLLETALLACFNHGSLVTTAAKRITSNTYAGMKYNIPVLGTMAHSLVTESDNEYEAFKKYSMSNPDNCVFLVDTYDTLKSGIPNAIKLADEYLKPNGIKFKGIRIDSGDLAYLSKEARKMLDEAGYKETNICLSNGLNEYTIRDLKNQGACIDSLGVGDNISAAKERLGGVYKLVAVKKDDKIIPKIKVSNDSIKTTNPGYKKTYRFYDKSTGYALGDVIVLAEEKISKNNYTLVHPVDTWKQKRLSNYHVRELQVPIFKNGVLVYEDPSIEDKKKYCENEFKTLYPEVTRIEKPHEYYVDLSEKLRKLKEELIKMQTSKNIENAKVKIKK